MKNIILSIGLICLLLSSCSQAYLEKENNDERKPILVSSSISARSTTLTNLQKFAFFAFDHTGNWADNKTTAPVWINNRTVQYSDNTWSYSPIAYWPKDKNVSFFAYSPIATSSNGITVQTEEFTGTPYIDFTIDFSKLSSTPDLVTDASCTDKLSSSGNIAFKLCHVLSGICINIKNETALASNKHFYISSMTLKSNTENIYSKARYNFDGNRWDHTNSLKHDNLSINELLFASNTKKTIENKDLIEVNQNGSDMSIIPTSNLLFCIPINDSGTQNLGDIQLNINYYTSTEENGTETLSELKAVDLKLPAGALKKGNLITYNISISNVIAIFSATVEPWSTNTESISVGD